MKRTYRRAAALAAAATMVMTSATALSAAPAQAAVSGFVTVSNARLTLGGQPYKIAGANVFNLPSYYVDGTDVSDPGVSLHINKPASEFKITAQLNTYQELGVNTIRIWGLGSFGKPGTLVPDAVGAPGTFDATVAARMDFLIKAAGDRGIRVLGGLAACCEKSNWGAFTAYPDTDPYSDASTQRQKQYISALLNRTNSITGLKYKDDPAILGWEIGNEEDPPVAWERAIAAHIKSIDTNHLVASAYQAFYHWTDEKLANPNVDMASNHDYGSTVADLPGWAETVTNSGNAFFIGEYSWTHENQEAWYTELQNNPDIAGAFFWDEQLGLDDYSGWTRKRVQNTAVNIPDAYQRLWTLHYPEQSAVRQARATRLRTHLYAIRGLPVPEDRGVIGAPVITGSAGSVITWRGATLSYRYSIERSTAGSSGPWTVVCDRCVSDVDGRWVDTTKPADRTVYYRMRGYNIDDVAGSYSAAYIAAQRIATRVDDAVFTYTGGWSSANLAGYENQTVHYTNTRGAAASYTFTGTGVNLIGATNSDHGIAQIYIDGVYDQVIDTYSANNVKGNVLYTRDGLTPGTHTIRIVVEDRRRHPESAGTYTDIDALEVISSGNTTDDGATGVSYSGGWATTTGTDYRNGGVHYSATTGATVTFSFSGKEIRVIGAYNNDHGKADVSIDNTYDATIDTYSATHDKQRIIYRKAFPTSATRTIRLTLKDPGARNPASSGNYTDIDAFEVLP